MMRGLLVLMFCLYGTLCVSDTARGKAVFKDYCAGCHTLKYLQYDPTDAPFASNALSTTDAQHWFGQKPPDLSLIAQTRGASWLSVYLMSFYPDEHQRFGSNNSLLPHLAMPDPFVSLRQELDPHELSELISDLVSYLEIVGDPSAPSRHRLAPWVLIYLLILGVVLVLYRKVFST